jgi:hypothetical protein
MTDDDLRDPFDTVPYDPRVLRVLGEVDLLDEIRRRHLKSGVPEGGPYGVELYDDVKEMRMSFNSLLSGLPLEELQLVASVRHLGRGDGGSWKELIRSVAEWYPTKDLAITQIKTAQRNLAKDLQIGLNALETELAAEESVH